MKPVTATHTCNGATQLLVLPARVRYLFVRNRNAAAWRIGFDSTGTLYLAMAGTDNYEWIAPEGQVLAEPVYVYGTGAHVLEYEYWL